MTDLVYRKQSPGRFAGFNDPILEAGAIDVDSDDYAAALDRIYDVKGFSNVYVEIQNTGPTNGLTYTIQKSREEFTAISDLTDADFNADVVADTNVTPIFATGTITCATVLAADTVTVNGLLYTAVSGAKANDTEFSVDTSDTACAADLADSITNDVRTGTLDDVTAISAVGLVTITQTVAGTAGNATTLESSNGTRLAVSGATFTGGALSTDTTNITSVSPEITAIRIRFKRQTSAQDTTLAGVVSAK